MSNLFQILVPVKGNVCAKFQVHSKFLSQYFFNLMFSKTLRVNGVLYRPFGFPVFNLRRKLLKFFSFSNVRNGKICKYVKNLLKRSSKSRDMKLFLGWRWNTPPLTRKPLNTPKGNTMLNHRLLHIVRLFPNLADALSVGLKIGPTASKVLYIFKLVKPDFSQDMRFLQGAN